MMNTKLYLPVTRGKNVENNEKIAAHQNTNNEETKKEEKTTRERSMLNNHVIQSYKSKLSKLQHTNTFNNQD